MWFYSEVLLCCRRLMAKHSCCETMRWLYVVLRWGLVVVLQEIDGKAFMLLNSEMMMKYMGLKLGPVLKLCNIIEKLRSRLKWRWAESITLTQALLIRASTAHPFRCNIFCCCLVVRLHLSLDSGSIHAGDFDGTAACYATNTCVSQMVCVDRFHCSLECAMNQGPEHHVSACLSCLVFSLLWLGGASPSEDISVCYCFPAHMWIHTNTHTRARMHARTHTHAHTHTSTHTHTELYTALPFGQLYSDFRRNLRDCLLQKRSGMVDDSWWCPHRKHWGIVDDRWRWIACDSLCWWVVESSATHFEETAFGISWMDARFVRFDCVCSVPRTRLPVLMVGVHCCWVSFFACSQLAWKSMQVYVTIGLVQHIRRADITCGRTCIIKGALVVYCSWQSLIF